MFGFSKNKINKKDFDLIIDVRTRGEFNTSHIKESINIDLDDIYSNFEKTELKNTSKDKKILLVCRSGNRSEMAKDILESKGFSNLENGGSFEDFIL